MRKWTSFLNGTSVAALWIGGVEVSNQQPANFFLWYGIVVATITGLALVILQHSEER